MPPFRTEEGVLTAIRAVFPASRGALRLAIGDDAALFQPKPGFQTILTCDWFLEGSHFLEARHPADAVGWKCLARATSDVAAMGGTPRCFLLGLALPARATGRWLAGFLAGLRRASRRLGCELAGGDTTRQERILIHITVLGEVPAQGAILRSGARPGDLLYVTGRLGEAELGLRRLRATRGTAKRGSAVLRKHLYPEPRLAIGQWLARKKLASAMMDLSDGLSTDLRRLCAASGVGARIELSRLPVSPLARPSDAVTLALHGGDDYELLFAVAPGDARKLPASLGGVALTRIGELVPGKSIRVRGNGRERSLPALGWDPFQS